ncbi:MAG: preprotein translocase subunit SecG [Tannerella sp.]|jgi:preprotein translocase subunit SecG|nr:preprotein translocase subunit SecG [Tannerella sp.]
MYVFISILILICSAVLVLVVLVQNSKGGGLASGFASSNQVLGVRKTTDFLEKATWTLAMAVIILCIGITAVIPREKVASNSEVLENVSSPVNTSVPDFGIAQPDAQEGVQVPAPQQEVPVAPQQEVPTE